ncbi:hypothetical protein [Streptomyces sp. CA-111067]|uniref:hypothetical protein n=1 Tax=Streptomyces sp. CA-111067 TaxID=3240046 RepID=UPI003D9690B9
MDLPDAPLLPMAPYGVELVPPEDARIRDSLRRLLGDAFGGPEVRRFLAPPVMARAVAERAGYTASFPHLIGTVATAPDGGEQVGTDLVLTPAACHHVFPLFAGRSVRRSEGIGVEAACFRAEKEQEQGRLRSFLMYETVWLGAAEEVDRWCTAALDRSEAWLRGLGLAARRQPASDPFFGRTGPWLAARQQSEQLKWELAVEVADGTVQAVASVNRHRRHFADAFAITLSDGTAAHSACTAFGLDRLVLALRHAHGEPDAWPPSLRTALSLPPAR